MMGRIRLYNVRTGRWEWYTHTDDVLKTRIGQRLRRVTDSLRQTWRRITGDTEDRTYYTFNPSELRLVDESKLKHVERLVRRAGRRESLMELLQAVADAVMSMVMMQNHLN